MCLFATIRDTLNIILSFGASFDQTQQSKRRKFWFCLSPLQIKDQLEIP